MKAPHGFRPIPLSDFLMRFDYQATHRRRIPGGWEFWNREKPQTITRVRWLSDAARAITTHEVNA